MDLQDARVLVYCQVYVIEKKPLTIATVVTFVVCAVVLGVLIFCSVRREKLQVS